MVRTCTDGAMGIHSGTYCDNDSDTDWDTCEALALAKVIGNGCMINKC